MNFQKLKCKAPLSRAYKKSFSTLNAVKKPKMKRGIFRKIGRGILYTSVASVIGTGIYAYYDNSFWRACVFYGKIMPMTMHYMGVQTKITWFEKGLSDKEKSMRFKPLHEKYADTVLDIILQMKGFYIKMGQMCAQRPDVLPREWLDNLRSLEDNVPPEDFPYVKAIVEKQLGKPIDELFSEFDEKPIGAASIGQVHRAVLRGTGQEVAVKVMYNDVEELFRGDFVTLKTFCHYFDPYDEPFMDEMEKQFLTEFDYVKEAQNLKEIAQNLTSEKAKKYAWSSRVVVPRPIMELCTQQILVMEFLPGTKLISAVMSRYEEMAKEQGMTLQELEEEFMKGATDAIEAVKGPTAAELNFYRSVIQIRDVLWNLMSFMLNYSFGWFYKLLGSGSETVILYKYSSLPPNTVELVDAMLDVHGYEIFVDGVFNGDPHAGNILLMPDERLGLIDYGQVKRLSVEDRLKLSHLMLALSDRDTDRIISAFKGMGFGTKYMKSWALERYAIVLFDNDIDKIDFVDEEGNEMPMMDFFMKLEWVDRLEKVPDDFVLVFYAGCLLRGTAWALGSPVKTSQKWKPYVEQFLEEHGFDKLGNKLEQESGDACTNGV